MSIELMFNAVNIALIAFSRYTVPAAMGAEQVSSVESEVASALEQGIPFFIEADGIEIVFLSIFSFQQNLHRHDKKIV